MSAAALTPAAAARDARLAGLERRRASMAAAKRRAATERSARLRAIAASHAPSSPGLATLARVVTDIALVTLIGLFAFEAAARWGLSLVGAGQLIFARDGLVALSIMLLFVDRLFNRGSILPFVLFGSAVVFHGMITMATLQSMFAVIFGVKVLLTFLLGLVAWDRLTKPNATLRSIFTVIFVATIVGVVLDKFLLDFPWLGVTIEVGGVERELGRQWWTEDERAGGFARSSIEIAQIAPLLVLTVLGYARGVALRALMIVVTLAVVYWTTQKGAILAFLLAAPPLLLPARFAGHVLNGVILFCVVLFIGMPMLLPGYSMPSADGVFSPMSFYLRIEEVWPESFAWVERAGSPLFGVGLGGAGGSLHYIAPEHYTPLDNIFLFFYAQFGLLGVVYLLAPVVFSLMQPPAKTTGDLTSRALLAYIYGYGVVLTVVESQVGSLFLGAAIGALVAGMKPLSKRVQTGGADSADPDDAQATADAADRSQSSFSIARARNAQAQARKRRAFVAKGGVHV